VTSLGIPGEFGQSAYVAEDLYKKYGMTADGLVAAAEALME
jgi:transketolase C-terminal domain/subunit